MASTNDLSGTMETFVSWALFGQFFVLLVFCLCIIVSDFVGFVCVCVFLVPLLGLFVFLSVHFIKGGDVELGGGCRKIWWK